MRVLVIGSGGREHALAKKLAESPHVEMVFCAPGNPGMEVEDICTVPIQITEHQKLIEFAKEQEISWTFVGPEIPLLNGIVDDFMAEDLAIFGPTKAAALIEGSKNFAKELMERHHVPTAKSKTFNQFQPAMDYVQRAGVPIVIKADGLAAGKGVVIAETFEEASVALTDMLENQRFGEQGQTVVIEEFLVGEEFSLLAFVKDDKVYPMIPAQDHKRIFDQDKGPNTGGMGAYAPVPQIDSVTIQQAVTEILIPVAKGLSDEGRSFTGILYAGLILTTEGPKVIEFNARFGDPETQVLLPLLTSDLAMIIDDLLADREPNITWNEEGYQLGVVLAAPGYPDVYQTGFALSLSADKSVFVDYAGVTKEQDMLLAAGGRVVMVHAFGNTLADAQKNVYDFLNKEQTNPLFYRKDIGHRGISYEK
ncbi:MAG: phosphoribosylamine--glycine ligase [Enterococcus sp.]